MVVVAAGTTLTFANSFAANVLICSAVVFYMKVLKVVCTCMCVSVGKLYEEIICPGKILPHTCTYLQLLGKESTGSFSIILALYYYIFLLNCDCVQVSSTSSYDQNLL